MSFKPKIGLMVKWSGDHINSLNKNRRGIILEVHKEKPHNGQVTIYWFGIEHKTEHIPIQWLEEAKDE